MTALNDALISEPIINVESMLDTFIIVFPLLIAIIVMIFIVIILYEIEKKLKGV